MNYLVIDLEMCNVPRDYRSRSYKYANETIQIGAVLLDEEFKRIGTLVYYGNCNSWENNRKSWRHGGKILR